MNQGFIKVAAGTPQVTVADCKANTRAILEVIREMETQHAKLMVLPELCITGYTCQDLFLQRRLLDSAWESLLTIAEETADVDALIFVGLPMRMNGKLYNVAAALNHGNILGFVPKTHIPNYNEFYEQRHFASGADVWTDVTVGRMASLIGSKAKQKAFEGCSKPSLSSRACRSTSSTRPLRPCCVIRRTVNAVAAVIYTFIRKKYF